MDTLQTCLINKPESTSWSIMSSSDSMSPLTLLDRDEGGVGFLLWHAGGLAADS